MIDVLIIGAGPTGLMMAIEAQRHGMKCRIIDKAAKPSILSKALAIQPRTLEIFDHLGLIDLFLNEGLQIRSATQYCRSKKLIHLSFDTLDSPYPFVLSLEQTKTEKILTDYLAFLGVQIEREVELVDIQEQRNSVLGICQNLKDGSTKEIEAKWAVGCDGAHSLVRKKLEFSFSGKAIHSAFSLADVRIQWDYPHDELFAFLNPEGILAAIPMPGKERYRLVFQLERCRDLLKEDDEGVHGLIKTIPDPTLDEVKDLVKKYIDPKAKVSEPLWLANFHINSRLVEWYQKGRVFIAGDAAHIHSPAGGQGMNSGFQDVFNLGWKLASGNRGLIETYTLERRSWGKNLVKSTRRFTDMITLKNPLAVAFRNKMMQLIFPFVEKKVIEAIAQTSIQYPKSQIVVESGSFNGGPKAGMRALNVPVGQTDLYSVMRSSTAHHLLCFGKIPDSLRQFESRWMRLIHMSHPEAIMKYGVKKEAIYMIRPDLCVGYRSTTFDIESIKSYYRSVFNN